MDITCQSSVNLNSHLFKIMPFQFLLPVWRCVAVQLSCPNFTELLIFERPRILVVPEMAHRAAFDIDNVLMFAFSVVLLHIFLGH